MPAKIDLPFCIFLVLMGTPYYLKQIGQYKLPFLKLEEISSQLCSAIFCSDAHKDGLFVSNTKDYALGSEKRS